MEDNDFVICYFYDDDQSKAQFSKQGGFFTGLAINLSSFQVSATYNLIEYSRNFTFVGN